MTDAQGEGVHTHCSHCYDRRCSVSPQPGNACSLTNCDTECGARFHKCKAVEHQLLCPNVKIECVNAIYGCPVDIQRKQLCRHLEVCPASVVNCTMEWNRWPVYASERQPQQPLQLVPDNFTQLDISLALRDQRMLTKSMKASKRTRQILTNALNRRHPAVPLSVQLTGNADLDSEEERGELENLLQVMQDEKEAADRERARTPPGLQRSICNELYRQTHDNNGLVASSGIPAYFLPRDPFIHCSHCARRKERMDRVMASHDAMQCDDAGNEVNGNEATEEGAVAGSPFSATGHTPPMESPNSFLHDKDCKMQNPFHLEQFTEGPDSMKPASLNSTFSSEDSDIQTPAVFVTQSTTGDVSAAPTRGHSKPIIIQPPAVSSSNGTRKVHRLSCSSNGSLDSRNSLSLDLSLESITRYQAKPDSMYTFLCAQEFRRDEYPYHFQNVHSDIHGGLNGWMEQRCPLAPYGCTFSQRRLYPGSQGARIVHSENLESFGLRVDGEMETNAEQECTEVANVSKYGDASITAVGEDLVNAAVGIDSAQGGVELEPQGNETSNHIGASLDCSDTKRDSSSNDNVTSSKSKCNGGEDSESNSGGVEKVVDSAKDDGKLVQSGSNSEQTDTKVNEWDQSNIENANTKESGSDYSNIEHADTKGNGLDQCEIESTQTIEQTEQSQETLPNFESELPSPTDGASSSVSETEAKHDCLSGLPFELLRYLARFLDSYTINHLAMTSKLLRQVCCSLLEERGMVVLQWEKQRGRWKTTMKVWHFSTAFTPITSWGFTNNPPIAEHLKVCPFNVRNVSSSPVRVMGNGVDPAKIANLKETPRRDKKVNGQNEWDLDDEDDVELLRDVDNWYFCEACS